MRKLALTILTTGIVLTVGHAHAQRYDPAYPVCLYVVSRGMTPYYRCSYYTMEQCRASVNGQMCSLNPYYAGTTAPAFCGYQTLKIASSAEPAAGVAPMSGRTLPIPRRPG
jgi:Protein of unknown function (DUF3551)